MCGIAQGRSRHELLRSSAGLKMMLLVSLTRTKELNAARLPLPAVQAALRKTTELLASELVRPSANAPVWSQDEWLIARAVATIHGVSALLAARLRWQGPPGWMGFLGEQSSHISQRFVRIQEFRERLDRQARARGIALVALKGAALYARGLYRAGERPMADVDLLVRESDAAQAAQMLTQLGLHAGAVTWKHRTFAPPDAGEATATLGEDAAAPVKVELHTQIREILPLRPVDISQLVFPAQPYPGINDYASHTAVLLHVLLHAAGALIARQVRLLHLHDIAQLTQRMSAADWDELLRQGASTADPSLWWAFPPLALANRYYGCVPQTVLARLAACCPWALRRTYRDRTLSDASLSYLWVSAFPGIEWSRSLREMLTYALERVRPSAATLALRVEFARSQPLVSGGEWAYTSQGRRIVRWLLARQPRQETLQPVRAAMSSAQGASR
jgi:hypothetical protein